MRNTVLAIDSDPDIIEALSLVLEPRGYRVVKARNSAEGLAKVPVEKPDVVIIDMLGPGVDSFTFRKEMGREQWKAFHNVPILVLTPQREETTRRRRREMHQEYASVAAEYIDKPICPEILLERIQRAMSSK